MHQCTRPAKRSKFNETKDEQQRSVPSPSDNIAEMNKTIALKLKSSKAKFAKSRESLGSDFTVLALEEDLVNVLNARKRNSVGGYMYWLFSQSKV